MVAFVFYDVGVSIFSFTLVFLEKIFKTSKITSRKRRKNILTHQFLDRRNKFPKLQKEAYCRKKTIF